MENIYIWYMRILPYILPAMQYFHILCLAGLANLCSRLKEKNEASKTKRLNCGTQSNRDPKTLRKGKHNNATENYDKSNLMSFGSCASGNVQ